MTSNWSGKEASGGNDFLVEARKGWFGGTHLTSVHQSSTVETPLQFLPDDLLLVRPSRLPGWFAAFESKKALVYRIGSEETLDRPWEGGREGCGWQEARLPI